MYEVLFQPSKHLSEIRFEVGKGSFGHKFFALCSRTTEDSLVEEYNRYLNRLEDKE